MHHAFKVINTLCFLFIAYRIDYSVKYYREQRIRKLSK